MTMAEWEGEIDRLLVFTEKPVLAGRWRRQPRQDGEHRAPAI